jgi:hypothetical protein
LAKQRIILGDHDSHHGGHHDTEVRRPSTTSEHDQPSFRALFVLEPTLADQRAAGNVPELRAGSTTMDFYPARLAVSRSGC